MYYLKLPTYKPGIVTMVKRIIFAELHIDQATARFLANIAPRLKEIGYDCFYDEIHSSLTSETLLSQLKPCEIQYQLLKDEFKSKGFTDINDATIAAYTELLYGGNPKNALIGFFVSSMRENIIRLENGVALLDLLAQLKQHNISYQGIDPLEPCGTLTGEEYEKLVSSRDRVMANHYISYCGNVFGRVGVAHVKGIQQNIIEKLTPDEANNSFHFIHLYSNADLYERSFKDNLDNLPLGITCINVNKISEAELVQIILSATQTNAATPSDYAKFFSVPNTTSSVTSGTSSEVVTLNIHGTGM